MDAQTCLICVVLVVISGAVLFFIAMFSMQEKTYEEAIAEQRKMPNDELLFGKSSKENKNKKRKRQGKKVKEKPTSNKVVNNKKNVKKQSSSETNFKLDHKENEHSHVNFLTPEAEVLNEVNSLSHLSNKKGKEKIKPILINKKEPAAVKIKTTPKDLPVNHFIEIIPKDDLQLKLIANVSF